MLTTRFERLFDGLVVRWKRYQATPRDPEGVPALAAARLDLDRARQEIATERASIEKWRAHMMLTRIAADERARHDQMLIRQSLARS